MKKKVYIQWSGLYDNDIMSLARRKDSFLEMGRCIFMYLGPDGTYEQPLHMDFLADDLYYGSVRDKLIENLGRSEIQELNNKANWSVSIAVGRVYTDSGISAPRQVLRDLCDELLSCNVTSPSQFESSRYDLVQLTDNLVPEQELRKTAV